VARTSGQPPFIAGIYPVITDGLGIVAYGLVPRLNGRTRLYAAATVVLAAGLSGLAQAAQLVNGVNVQPPAVVRFAIGAWPVVAVLLAAHLWWLATRPATPARPVVDAASRQEATAPVRPAVQAGTVEPTKRQLALIAAQELQLKHGRVPTVAEIRGRTSYSQGVAGQARKDLLAAANGQR
jgi:hypothetical protein